jgi:hydrogenase maturation protease
VTSDSSETARRPVLLIGLGNPLMGDEGIGYILAERLRADPRVPDHVEVICGGTDFLRYAAEIAGRQHVILVDSLLDRQAGDVTVITGCFQGLDSHQGSVHCLSVVQAIELLRAVQPQLNSVRFTLFGVGITSASARRELSAALGASVPGLVERLLEGFRATVSK